MSVTPSATARRSVRIASPISRGGPQMPGPVRRIAPKPSLTTGRSPPIRYVPASAASRAVPVVVAMWTPICPLQPLADARLQTEPGGVSPDARPSSGSCQHPRTWQIAGNDRVSRVVGQGSNSSRWVQPCVLRKVAGAEHKQIRHAPDLAKFVDYRRPGIVAHHRSPTDVSCLVGDDVEVAQPAIDLLNGRAQLVHD